LNDVIADVNGQPVSTKEQMVGALEKRNSGRAGVSLYRDGRRLDFNMELNPINQTASSEEIPKNDYPAASASAPIREATGGVGAAAGVSTPVGLAVPLSGEFALQLAPGHPRPGVRTGGEFLAALDNSLWVPDGRPSDKQIYIIAGPCCGYSRALYRETRNVAGVQMRWVEESPTPNEKCLSYLGEIASRGDSGVLLEMYETLSEAQPAPFLSRDNANRWNDGVIGAVYDMVNALNPEHPNQFQYPTVVWLSKEGVRVAVRPKNIEAILASVIPRPDATNLTSRGRSFVSASYQYQTFPQRVFLAKYEGVALYTFPDPNSQLVYRLQKDLGYYGGRRVVVAGEPWIELSLHGKGEPGLFVKEAQVYPSK
jgi:hypothetical protein